MTRIDVRPGHPLVPGKPRINRALIGGKWCEAEDWIERASPAHGVVVSRTVSGTEAMVHEAVVAARAAFEGTWRRLYCGERAALLGRAADLIRARADELALWDVLESGKPISQARAEIAGAADLWDYAAALARTISGESANHIGPDSVAMVLREPVGVVAQITPWNFPFLIVSQKLPYALAAGCTAVVKPSEFTSSSTVILCEILREAGFPHGVVNVVPGYGNPVGQAMAEHPDVDMISFTGSTRVGKAIVAASAGNLKKVAAELGGKNPAIVFADADLDEAADALVMGAVFNAGQCCVGSSRLLVEKSIAEDFTGRVAGLMRHLVIGDPLDDATQVGPIVNSSQYARVSAYIEDGKRMARLRSEDAKDQPGGLFLRPHVFDRVRPEMSIAREEIFGPVLSIIEFDGIAEALQIANATSYGLSSSVWTSSFETALRMARGIDAGTVWVNTYLEGPAEVPFGGFKQSGLGRENGRAAIEEYTELKTVLMRAGPRPSRYVRMPERNG